MVSKTSEMPLRCRRLARRAPRRSALLAGLTAGTLTLADVLGRDDDLARKTKVAQVGRALPGVGKTRAAAIMGRAGIPAERRVGGLSARQREQLLAGGRRPVTLSSLSQLTAAPGPRRPNESHTTSAGSRIESDEPGT